MAIDAAALRERGFTGFASVMALREDGAAAVPAEEGVWVVLREWEEAPRFLPRSSAAHWRGLDPSVPAEELAARWLPGASLLYVELAEGSGVRSRLQQRIKRFLRFGAGKNVGHWQGRFIWQLAGASALRIAWKVAPSGVAGTEAQELLARFRAEYAAAPFANETGESRS
jgi:hypothetical protein